MPIVRSQIPTLKAAWADGLFHYVCVPRVRFRKWQDAAVMHSLSVAVTASVTTFAATSIDDLILLTFFFGHRVSPRRIVAGQYLGFGAIICATLIAMGFTSGLPHRWIRVLGLLPIAIGIKHLIYMPNAQAARQKWKDSRATRIAFFIFSSGADNVGVYLPFLLVERVYLWAILGTYTILIAVWCLMAKWLGSRPVLLHQFDTRGHWIMPGVLILLGVYVLHS